MAAVPASSSPLQFISGRYRGRNEEHEIELRVDVGGAPRTHRVSADYYRVSDGEPTGSMRIAAPVVTVSATAVTITGRADFTWETVYRNILVTIRRVAGSRAHLPATVRHSGAIHRPGAIYRCAFESVWFRRVEFEEAVQSGVTPFASYDTGSIPSVGPARPLSVPGAFAEAGIELRSSGPPARVDTAAGGADEAWSDAELHAAMEANFTRYNERAQWAIWLFHATSHDGDARAARVQGVMFDHRGAQRQGCAIFYDDMPGATPDGLRRQLHTCVHELAHGFNLLHCWQRSSGRPPLESRPDAATWMNYPERFPGGDKAFWSAFGFCFDDDELAHLRHAFREDAIMGGAPFGASSPLRRLPNWGDPATQERDGSLRLAVRIDRTRAYGEPIALDLELSCHVPGGRLVHSVLGPRSGTVDIAIGKPGGETVVFEPLLRYCRGSETHRLRPADGPLRDAAFVHYGSDDYAFSEPGVYKLQARYTTLDGLYVYSRVVPLRVLRPRSAGEHALGEMIYGDPSVGVLMSVLGSDAPRLAGGNATLRKLAERYPDHGAGQVARVILGANDAREFKSVGADGRLGVRPPDLLSARSLVEPIIDVERLEIAASVARRAAARRRPQGPGAPTAIATRPGVARSVDAYLRSRVDEVNVEVPTIPFRSNFRLPPVTPIADRRPDESPSSSVRRHHKRLPR